MIRSALLCFAIGFSLCRPGLVVAQGSVGEAAPEFPAGATFTDGGQYQLADLKGKVVVLFFFESQCPRCRGTIPARSALVKSMQGKPVVFLAVGPHITMPEALGYQKETGLAMPIYPDGLGLMQARYGFKISLKNIWQFRVVGPDGKVKDDSMTAEAIDKVVGDGKVERKYKPADAGNPKIAPVADMLEFGQFGPGMKALSPLRQNGNKAIAASAQSLYDEAKIEGEKWKAEAAVAAESDPLKAYDLYSKVAAAFPKEEMGQSAAAAVRKLAVNPAVSSELSARKAFALIKFNQATIENGPAVLQSCDAIVKKHPKTPTADKAAALAKELRTLVKK